MGDNVCLEGKESKHNYQHQQSPPSFHYSTLHIGNYYNLINPGRLRYMPSMTTRSDKNYVFKY